MKNHAELKDVARLLEVTEDDLDKALCHRVIAAMGEVMEKALTLSEAIYARDAFAKVCLVLVYYLYAGPSHMFFLRRKFPFWIFYCGISIRYLYKLVYSIKHSENEYVIHDSNNDDLVVFGMVVR